MRKTLAHIFSTIFHPLLMPTWATLLFTSKDSYAFAHVNKGLIILLVFLHSFFFPFVFVMMMKQLGFITSIHMKDKQERTIPFIATMTIYIWFFMVIKSKQLPVPFTLFVLGAVISLCISFVVNIFHKTSIHMVACSGLLFAIFISIFISTADWSNAFVAMIVLCGIIATSRLILQAHTPREVYSGFLIGMFGQLLAQYAAPFLW